MKLTEEIFESYVSKLKKVNVQIIHSEVVLEKLKNDQIISVYIGYEPSGALHLGHLTGLLMLEQFSKFENVTVIALISTFHAKANKKQVDYTLLYQMQKAHKNKPVEHILSSTTEITSNSYRNNFMYTSEYLNLVYQRTANIKFKKLKKATAFFERANYIELAITQILYPVYQASDIDYFKFDIAIGGFDQRKIHMFHSDNFKQKTCYIHLPILPTKTGKKMSKSESVSCISLNDELFKQKYEQYIQSNPHVAELFKAVNDTEDIANTTYDKYRL